MILKMKKLKENAVVPERKTDGSAGYDLCACIEKDFVLNIGDLAIIPTGLAIEVPLGHAGMVFTRSGLGAKHGVHLSNGVGVIDSDYRGEVHVALTNSGKVPYVICPGERIAQLITMPIVLPDIELVEELTETERGEGGFGSTGR
jgi:deoxyuridine 5''-triphosphate nucleotidohydrolase (dut)